MTIDGAAKAEVARRTEVRMEEIIFGAVKEIDGGEDAEEVKNGW